MKINQKHKHLIIDCNCNVQGSLTNSCNSNGVCICKNDNIVGDKCTECKPGLINFPDCSPMLPECNCSTTGTVSCSNNDAICECITGYSGSKCNTCIDGYYELAEVNGDVTCRGIY